MPLEARQTDPAAIGEQVPTLPARLQDEQAPVQALLQQMPLTQVSPDAHWLVAPHAPPWAWNPQPPLAQMPGQLWVAELAQLLEAHRGKRHMIVLQNFPDPDAISSAYGHQLISAQFGIETDIVLTAISADTTRFSLEQQGRETAGGTFRVAA